MTTLILKYLSWLLAVGVGFAGSWLFEFTVTDKDSKRKRLTRSGKWGAGLAFIGLVSALCWTALDDMARQKEKEDLARSQEESARRQAELLQSQNGVRQGQLTIVQKQEELDHAMEVVTFLLREERGAATDDERRTYLESLEAISGLLTERDSELLRELAQLPVEEIVTAAEQLPRETVDLIVSNSPECLLLLQRTSNDESGRRMLALLSERLRVAAVVSVLGDGSLNFRLMQPADEFDLSDGFELEFDGGRTIRITRDRCEIGFGCDVSVMMAEPESWERALVVELASADIRRLGSLANPGMSILVAPSAASEIRRAFGCVVDR